MMKKYTTLLITLFLLLPALAACHTAPVLLRGAGAPESTDEAPLPQPAVAITQAPPSEYSLGSVTVTQAGKAPDYTTKIETPVMNGSSDPRVVKFNQAVSQVIQQEVDAFKKSLEGLPATPISAGSSFALHPVPVSPAGKIISLQLKIETYVDGAAHPYDYTVTFNYDLQNGQVIALDTLFKPGANYLQTLSNYCTSELNKTDLASVLFTDGLRPTAENYRNWNITADGLAIIFNEYQVAPYAAGPQTVVIPYAELKDISNSNGPLSNFINP